MEPITLRNAENNSVNSMRGFSTDTVYCDYIKTSSNKTVNMNEVINTEELNQLKTRVDLVELDITNIKTELTTIDSTVSGIIANTSTMNIDLNNLSIDIQTDLVMPLYQSTSDITRMSALADYVNNSVSTSLANAVYSTDPFLALMNVNTSLTSTVSISFSNMRNHPFNTVSTLTDLKTMPFGKVEFIVPIAPTSTTSLNNIIDCCDRYFDFYFDFSSIATSTRLTNGLPVFIPDRVLNVFDGTVYKCRALKSYGTANSFNPSPSNVGHMYLFIRNVLKMRNNCIYNTFATGITAWSSLYLNIILCGEIGLDSYNSSVAQPNNWVKCKSLWSPGRPRYIYQALGIFVNNFYLVLSPGNAPVAWQFYLDNAYNGNKFADILWLPYFANANPTGGLKEDGTITSSTLTTDNTTTYANSKQYLIQGSDLHRFYSYILYLSKI